MEREPLKEYKSDSRISTEQIVESAVAEKVEFTTDTIIEWFISICKKSLADMPCIESPPQVLSPTLKSDRILLGENLLPIGLGMDSLILKLLSEDLLNEEEIENIFNGFVMNLKKTISERHDYFDLFFEKSEREFDYHPKKRDMKMIYQIRYDQEKNEYYFIKVMDPISCPIRYQINGQAIQPNFGSYMPLEYNTVIIYKAEVTLWNVIEELIDKMDPRYGNYLVNGKPCETLMDPLNRYDIVNYVTNSKKKGEVKMNLEKYNQKIREQLAKCMDKKLLSKTVKTSHAAIKWRAKFGGMTKTDLKKRRERIHTKSVTNMFVEGFLEIWKKALDEVVIDKDPDLTTFSSELLELYPRSLVPRGQSLQILYEKIEETCLDVDTRQELISSFVKNLKTCIKRDEVFEIYRERGEMKAPYLPRINTSQVPIEISYWLTCAAHAKNSFSLIKTINIMTTKIYWCVQEVQDPELRDEPILHEKIFYTDNLTLWDVIGEMLDHMDPRFGNYTVNEEPVTTLKQTIQDNDRILYISNNLAK